MHVIIMSGFDSDLKLVTCNGFTKCYFHFIFVPVVDHQSHVLCSSNVGRHFSVYPTDAALLSM